MKLNFPILATRELVAILDALDAPYDFYSSCAVSVYFRLMYLLGAANRIDCVPSSEHSASFPLLQLYRAVAALIFRASAGKLQFTLYDLVEARTVRSRVFLSCLLNYAVYHARYCETIKKMHAARGYRIRALTLLAKQHDALLERFNVTYFQYMDSKALLKDTNTALTDSRLALEAIYAQYERARQQCAYLTYYREEKAVRIAELRQKVGNAREYLSEAYEKIATLPGAQASRGAVVLLEAQKTDAENRVAALQHEIDTTMALHERMRELYKHYQANKQFYRELAMALDKYNYVNDNQAAAADVPQNQSTEAVEYPQIPFDVDENECENVDELERTRDALAEETHRMAEDASEKRNAHEKLTTQTACLKTSATDLQNKLCAQINEYIRAFVLQAQEFETERAAFIAREQALRSVSK